MTYEGKDPEEPKKRKGKTPGTKAGKAVEKAVVEATRGEIKTIVPPAVLSEALDRIIAEPEIQDRMEKEPLETLAELGIKFDRETRERLTGKTLDELVAEDLLGEVALIVAPFVAVLTRGTRPGVSSRVGSVVKTGATSVTKTSTITTTATATATGVKTVVDTQAFEE